jgi:hypothetical protein
VDFLVVCGFYLWVSNLEFCSAIYLIMGFKNLSFGWRIERLSVGNEQNVSAVLDKD